MEGPELKKRKIHKPPPRRSVSCTLSRAQMRSRSLKSASVGEIRFASSRGKTVASPASKTLKDAKPTSSSRIPGVQTSDINSFRIQQDKNFAVAQAQQDGCTGNFMKFDSWYGNFLVPVVPSRAELNR
ncbi:hypothetical protein Goklo_005961 [Gossypium klotzschianum]|uniref:Uncharacterized protein n=1 Tax=Gossypium klotzschianum TaxID=34286 RepID=A0A7J8VFW7_9ROSI|nr:hypothetical protein [Gossypium klotzschianum]